MQRIIYISTARTVLDRRALNKILLTSRRNNAAVDVTGLLVVGGRRFLQALEGPDHAVAATLRRIEQDPRHFAIVTLSRKPIEVRTFGDWSMGFEQGGIAVGDDSNLKAVVDRLVQPIADQMIRAYFTEFAALHAAA